MGDALERVGAAVMLGDKVVAVWMRGSWYSIVKGDYDVVTDPAKIRDYNSAPVAQSEIASRKLRTIDSLGAIRDIKRCRT